MEKGYDYIVIGSGSAGAIVAARLSEDPAADVLLLEAGRKDDHLFMGMPLAFPKVATSKHYIWPFESEPEPGLNGRTLPIWRGKTLGGCSSINAMINVRGSRHDFDLWRSQGLDGWGYADVLPYFRKLERSWRGEDDFHGAAGPVGNALIDRADSGFEALRQSVEALGLPFTDDHNGAAQLGISRVELTTNRGRRASSARAYLRPAMKRPNLTVLTHAQVTRIVTESGRATGVEFLHHGRPQTVTCDGEVILSAGTYASPQLLMLSGIGPADHLDSMGIAPVVDLPGVGANLQEHPNLLNIYEAQGKIGLSRHLRLDRATLAVARWALTGDGPFATAGTVANVFLQTETALDSRPDVQIIIMPIHQHAELWFPGLTRPPVFAFTARVGILHARSRGSVRLRSADPLDLPRIRFNMFSEPEDMRAMIKAVRFSRELFEQAPMRKLVSKELLPGDDCQTDAQLEHAIREQAEHRHHAVGTCKTGIGGDAVVGADLRVHGFENLRVADASVMPEDPSGNTNVPTLMIGERAADLIKGRVLASAFV